MLLDGSTNHVFSYSEVFDGNRGFLQTFIKKNIDPGDIGRIGGNRDVLDFAQYFALRDNLTGNGFQNDWRSVVNAGMDVNDDGLHNGSQGVMFVGSHDDHGPFLSNVGHAYALMHPGNTVVYFNAKEHGNNRDFPKDGRGDALGGVFGDALRKLVEIRNTHGRGNYAERWIEKELHAYERVSSAIVLMSNRLDSGFDSRTLTHVGFAPGTHLIELTGNAENPNIDPFDDIPSVVQVFEEGGVNKVNVRFPRNSANGNFHGNGYVVYGLPTPVAPDGLELIGVDSVMQGGNTNPDSFANGTMRLTDLHVVKGDTLTARLQTVEVNLLGSIRDVFADGDNALIKIDAGRDVNGNGFVDFTDADGVQYGFETFGTKSNPLIGPQGLSGPRGDGEFIQNIDVAQLEEGVHFIEAIAFRHRTDGGPPVFSRFTKSIYVDRLPPESTVDSFEPFDANFQENRDLIVRSLDLTADSANVFLNLPATMSDSEIIAMAASGQNHAEQIDRDKFAFAFFGVPHGNNVVTVVTWEPTGNANVQRFTGLFADTVVGRGVGDITLDGTFGLDDLSGTPNAFEALLYSQNAQFNPAADVNGDGMIDNRDLYALGDVLNSGGAGQDVLNEYANVLMRRGNVNQAFGTDAFDIDFLYDQFGSNDWLFDLDSSGVVDQGDVDALVRLILNTDYGDVNLDGSIDAADFGLLAANAGRAGGWALGNLDGDAFIDIDDFFMLRDALVAAGDTAAVAQLDAWLGVRIPSGGGGAGVSTTNNGAATIPEPTALSWLVVFALLPRRRVRRVRRS